VLRSAGGLIFCGTIRSPAFEAKPPGVTRRVALSRVLANESLAMPQDGVRTFLPLLRLAAQQPAITRPARWVKYTLQIHVFCRCTIAAAMLMELGC